jgi:diguanylate cyclase (GGDEF)-like protein
MSPSLLASYSVQAAGALFTAVLFGFFSRTYRKPFLLHWARAWSAMCIALVGAALTAAIADAPPTSAGRLTIAAVTAVAAYAHVAWLLLGAAELSTTRLADKLYRYRGVLFILAAAIGLVSAGLFVSDIAPFGRRLIVRVGLPAGVMGVVFVLAAVSVWSTRSTAVRRSLGRGFVGGAFVLYAAIQLHLLFSTIVRPEALAAPNYALYTGFIAFVLVFTMGLGVVIWLLEEEHTKARDTTEQIAQLAFHDPLTGLPNRKLLLDYLTLNISQARRERTKVAIFFIDLDRFKVINDSLGHSAGDKVLQAVATRVKAAMREADSVGRMGGDEFVVVTPDIHGVEDAVHIAQKVRDAIREPLQVDARELFVSGSMGIAMYPNDGETAETLLKNADTAMYRAKAQGSDLFQLYTPEMNAHATEQLALENALRRAVEAKEFELHYQPIVLTSDNKIVALETMLRWRHPVLGLVRPEQFIRLAESSGMIVEIGEWTLRTACKQLAEWRNAGYKDLRLAVNISGRQLKQPDFVDQVRIVLAETSLAGSSLEFEITEFVRDLVLDPNDAAIATAVVALAKSMGLTVIAEGVENPAQLEFLRQQGCEMWQGYLFCPPVQTSEVRGVLGRRSGGSLKRVATPGDIAAVKH